MKIAKLFSSKRGYRSYCKEKHKWVYLTEVEQGEKCEAKT